jgi:hypothetical protein
MYGRRNTSSTKKGPPLTLRSGPPLHVSELPAGRLFVPAGYEPQRMATTLAVPSCPGARL